MGEQLNHTNAEVFYVDFSAMSMAISKNRAIIRQLSNILWVNDWIESIPYLGLGYFDLIICTGVLHHMKDPSRGLRRLNEIQKEGGGAVIMMYGKYGRTGIYHMQDLMRLVNKHEKLLKAEVSNAKRIMDVIPSDAAFLQLTGDHKTMGDIGVYDIFLNKRDVCFEIVYLHKFVKNNGYSFVSFDDPKVRIDMNLNTHLITDSGAHNKDLTTRQAIAEILIGNLKMHSFYVSKRKWSKAMLNNPKMNVILNVIPLGLLDVIDDSNNYINIGNVSFICGSLEKRYFEDGNPKPGQIGSFYDHIATFCWPYTDIGSSLLKLIAYDKSAKASFDDIMKRYRRKYKSTYTYKDMYESFQNLYWYFELSGMIILKGQSISPYPKTEKPQVRLSLANRLVQRIPE